MKNQDKKNTEQDVEIGPLLEDIVNKVNLLSQYHFSVLNKVNDLYIRLEINSRVIDEVSTKLGISNEDYINIVRKCVKEVNEVVSKSPLMKADSTSS